MIAWAWAWGWRWWFGLWLSGAAALDAHPCAPQAARRAPAPVVALRRGPSVRPHTASGLTRRVWPS